MRPAMQSVRRWLELDRPVDEGHLVLSGGPHRGDEDRDRGDPEQGGRAPPPLDDLADPGTMATPRRARASGTDGVAHRALPR